MAKSSRLAIGLVTLVGLAIFLAAPGPVSADSIKAKLQGFNEVPAVSTTGSGAFKGKISKHQDAIDYELAYDGIEGTILQAHIHLAQKSVNGGIILFLCATNTTTPAAAPAGTPLCPTNGGTVTGTLTSSSIIPVLGQGIESGSAEFAEIIHAMRKGVTYVNVHSSPSHVGGEIRGQIRFDD